MEENKIIENELVEVESTELVTEETSEGSGLGTVILLGIGIGTGMAIKAGWDWGKKKVQDHKLAKARAYVEKMDGDFEEIDDEEYEDFSDLDDSEE